MKMFLLNSLKKDKPTYIVSCDIKSAYDNVNQNLLFKHFQEKILSDMDEDPDRENFRESTEMLLYYILKAPNVKIYERNPTIHLTKGV